MYLKEETVAPNFADRFAFLMRDIGQVFKEKFDYAEFIFEFI